MASEACGKCLMHDNLESDFKDFRNHCSETDDKLFEKIDALRTGINKDFDNNRREREAEYRSNRTFALSIVVVVVSFVVGFATYINSVTSKNSTSIEVIKDDISDVTIDITYIRNKFNGVSND